MLGIGLDLPSDPLDMDIVTQDGQANLGAAAAAAVHAIAVPATAGPEPAQFPLPARSQMRTEAHTKARRRVGLRAYSSSTSDIDASSDASGLEPPNLALGSGSNVNRNSSFTGCEAKDQGKRKQQEMGFSSDAEGDGDFVSPPKKRASSARVQRLGKGKGKGKMMGDEMGDDEMSATDLDPAQARLSLRGASGRKPLGSMVAQRASNTLPPRMRQIIAASSSTDDLAEAVKSSSPRPIPSVVKPYGMPATADAAPSALAKKKDKGKGKAAEQPISTPKARKGKVAGRGKDARNMGSTSAFTLDSIAGPGEGSYALPAPPAETDVGKWKRKKQLEAFQGVEPAQGDGPYGYYNCEFPLPGLPGSCITSQSPGETS
jgi:hypothetical protein